MFFLVRSSYWLCLRPRLLTSSQDTLTGVFIWTVAEQGLVITAGCCGTFRTLFVQPKRSADISDGTRGRTGRPPQPGDTKVEWDPGLTIGYVEVEVTEDETCRHWTPLAQIRSGERLLDVRSDSSGDICTEGKSGLSSHAAEIV